MTNFICELKFVKLCLLRKKGCVILTNVLGLVTKHYGFYDYIPYILLRKSKVCVVDKNHDLKYNELTEFIGEKHGTSYRTDCLELP